MACPVSFRVLLRQNNIVIIIQMPNETWSRKLKWNRVENAKRVPPYSGFLSLFLSFFTSFSFSRLSVHTCDSPRIPRKPMYKTLSKSHYTWYVCIYLDILEPLHLLSDKSLLNSHLVQMMRASWTTTKISFGLVLHYIWRMAPIHKYTQAHISTLNAKKNSIEVAEFIALGHMAESNGMINHSTYFN